ncbi:hypothetical protein [Actinomadura hibisca]|uniref:hypothetical protein n=1 Tax=Actinomadura hibisca TaxID=68565 RepID=UPI00083549B2|nr:hypothetical protein [Actinomadura hibisca]
MSTEKPFDAHEAYLCDKGREPSCWQTTSLVKSIRSGLEGGLYSPTESADGRLSAVRTAARELSRRGLDAHSLIRYGMGQQIVGSVVMAVLSAHVVPYIRIHRPLEIEDFDRDGWLADFDLDGWLKVLDLQEKPAPPANSDEFLRYVGQVVTGMFDSIMPWLATAPIEDLVLLRPPHRIEKLTQDRLQGDLELHRYYRWAVDHFSSTFFQEWATSSLHLAHRWLRGHETPPCGEDLMRERDIVTAQLNEEIALRVVDDQGESVPWENGITVVNTAASEGGNLAATSVQLLEPQMSNHALRLLKQERFREAAAIFEFAVHAIPQNSQFHHHWGFCLMPVEPSEAYKHLVDANELGYTNRARNIYHRMCCLTAVGKETVALQLADSGWRVIAAEPAADAIVWDLTRQPAWQLREVDDIRAGVAELAAHIARRKGQEEEERRWQARLDEL